MASKFLSEWPRMAQNVVFAYELPLVHERWTYVLSWFVCRMNIFIQQAFNKIVHKFRSFQMNITVIAMEHFSNRNRFLRSYAKTTDETFCYVIHVLHSELIAFQHLGSVNVTYNVRTLQTYSG